VNNESGEYNGWKNKETWLINVHLGSDWLAEIANQAIDEGLSEVQLSGRLEAVVTECVMSSASNLDALAENLLQCSLANTDWDRFAEIFHSKAEQV
jgi:hypothetical protein